jgi:hypothetical protein
MAGQHSGNVEFDVGSAATGAKLLQLPAGAADVRADHDQAVPGAPRRWPELCSAQRRLGADTGECAHE